MKLKKVLSWPMYLIAGIGLLILMVGLKAIDLIYGNKKASLRFLRELLNHDQAPVDMIQPSQPQGLPKLFLYR
jgi:hypothetical protein